MKFEITSQQLQALGNFLGKQPYQEVFEIINMLQILPKIEEKADPK